MLGSLIRPEVTLLTLERLVENYPVSDPDGRKVITGLAEYVRKYVETIITGVTRPESGRPVAVTPNEFGQVIGPVLANIFDRVNDSNRGLIAILINVTTACGGQLVSSDYSSSGCPAGLSTKSCLALPGSY